VRLTESERTVSSELDLSLKLLSERLASCAICSVCSSCVDCWSCDTGVLTGNAGRQINRLTVGGVGSGGCGDETMRAACRARAWLPNDRAAVLPGAVTTVLPRQSDLFASDQSEKRTNC